MITTPSEQFKTCRKLVHNDAFEAQLAAKMAAPLIRGELNKMQDHYSVGLFLRRAITRYLGLVVSRLLEKPGGGGTGITASIASLLEMHKTRQSSAVIKFSASFQTSKQSKFRRRMENMILCVPFANSEIFIWRTR